MIRIKLRIVLDSCGCARGENQRACVNEKFANV